MITLGDLSRELSKGPFAGNSYEENILRRYSTPGLRKNQLDRAAKKEQLNAQGMSKFPADRDKILDELYPRMVQTLFFVDVSIGPTSSTPLPAENVLIAVPPQDTRSIEHIEMRSYLDEEALAIRKKYDAIIAENREAKR